MRSTAPRLEQHSPSAQQGGTSACSAGPYTDSPYIADQRERIGHLLRGCRADGPVAQRASLTSSSNAKSYQPRRMSIKPAARKAATDTLSIKKIVKGADDTAVDAEMAEIAGLVDQRLKKVPTLSGVAAPVQTSGNWTDFTAELQHYVSQLEAATQGVPALQQVERDIAHLRLLSNMMADLSYGYRSVRQRGYRIGTEATSIAKLRDQNGDLLAISTYLADELDENSLQRDTSKSYLSNIASFSKGAGATLAGEIMESEKRTELFLHPLSEEVQKVYEGSAYGGHVL